MIYENPKTREIAKIQEDEDLNSASWWYLEGYIDALEALDLWTGWSPVLENKSRGLKAAYEQGYRDGEADEGL